MASEKIIFEEDLPLAKSILGVITGTEGYYVPNEFFPDATKFNPKYNSFKKISTDDTKGKRFSSTSVCMAGSNRWVLALADNASTGKEYFIGMPNEDSLKSLGIDKPSINFNISLNHKDVEPTEGDNKLATFDYQMSVINTVLLVARALGIELKTFNHKENNDNKTFLTAFIKEVAAKVGGKATAFVPTDEFLKSFESAPYYKNLGKGNFMIISDEEIKTIGADINEVGNLVEPSFFTLFQLIKKKIACYAQNWKNAVKNKNIIDLFDNDKYEPTPGVIKQLYADGSGNWHKSIKVRTQIYPEHKNPKYGKLGFLTAKLVQRKKLANSNQSVAVKKPINFNELAALWGGNYKDEVFGSDKTFASHIGVLSLSYNFDNRFYAMAGPVGTWRVDQISMKRVEREVAEYALDDRWVGGDYETEGVSLADALEGHVESTSDEGDAYEKPPW